MKSFAEYFEIREADAIADAAVGAWRGMQGWSLRNKDQNELENQAIRALSAAINNLQQSDDPKLQALYNGGYARELYKIMQFIQGRNEKQRVKDPDFVEPTEPETAQEGFIGGAIGALGGGAIGGVPGAVMGGVAGHYAQKGFSYATSAMRKQNDLENQAIKAMQAVADRLKYEKGQKYHSGYVAILQGWIDRMKQMQKFNNQVQPSKIDPSSGYSLRRVLNKPKRGVPQIPQQQSTPSTPSTPRRDPRFT
jgi:hypothetical protein